MKKHHPAHRLACLLVIVSFIATGWSAGAAVAEWKVGMASVNITPREPVFMAGYASRNKPSEGAVSDLYAKALALQDAQGNRAVLVATDLIGFRAAISEPLCERISAKTGLKRSQILLNSSHTHTGPALTVSDRGVIGLQEQDRANARYAEWLQERVIEAVEKALAGMEPARLSWGVGIAHFVMNRREFTARGVILGVNPRGHADRSVPVLRIDSPDGKLRGVLFGAACHNTTLTDKHYNLSGDYAGFAQEYVQKHLPSAQAMFITGFAGDANPHPRGTLEYAREHGENLGKEILRVLETKLEPVRGPLKAELDWVNLPLQTPPSREDIEQLVAKGASYQKFVAGKMLEALDRGEKLQTQYRAPIALWQFGLDLTLVGLPGEVVVDYVGFLEQALGPRQLWLSAYCNDVFGYVPSVKVLREGGYETRGIYHGGIGFFAPETQDVIVAKVRELARKAGRSVNP